MKRPENTMDRRRFLQQLAAGAIMMQANAGAAPATRKERPNILLILTDQQNATMLGCTGNRYVSTPALDTLASEGVRFERAYCCNPVCSPSRFSLMTGLMPSVINMYSNRSNHIAAIPESIKRQGLGNLFKAAGYDAAYAGKTHLPRMSAADIGFDVIERDERDQMAATCAHYIKQRREKPFFLVASFINPHDICYMAIRDFAETAAERRLIERGATECSALDQALTHPPGMDDANFFAGPCPPLPVNFEPQANEPEAIRMLLASRPFRNKARHIWSESRWREHRWAYARLTESVDKQIALVLDALNHSGQSDRTLVVFTSDHGDMDASHRMEHKSTLYDEACRIPLIIRPPTRNRRGRVDRTHLVSNGLDLLPTLCDYAGILAPSSIPGKSLRPIMDGKAETTWRKSVPVECAMGRAIVTDRFKYMVYDIGEQREHLIDLAADPHELRNARHDPHLQTFLPQLREMHTSTFVNAIRKQEDVLLDLGEG